MSPLSSDESSDATPVVSPTRDSPEVSTTGSSSTASPEVSPRPSIKKSVSFNGTVSVHHFDFDPAEYESSIDSDAFSDDVTDSDSEVDEAMDAYIKSLLEKGIRFSRRLIEYL